MKNKFEILNDVKINTEEYKEIKFDNNDEIKSRMKSKIKSRKVSYKKSMVAASLVIVLGCGVMSDETVWANVEQMWYSVQSILNMKKEEILAYKYEINKSVESKDIKVTYKNLMIDDGNLIVEIDVDDSKFNPLEDFTQKQQKDWNIDKWGDRKTFISLGNIEAYVDGEQRGILHSGQADYDNKDRNSQGITSVVSTISLNEIEGEPITEKSGEYSVKEVGKDKFPYSIDKDKIYNIKLNTKKIHLSAEMTKEEQVGHGGAIRSDWSVDIPIKGEDLIKATVNYDQYTIDENIKINIDGVEKELQFDNLYLSPIYAKLQYTTDIKGYYINDKYDVEIKLENDNNEEYQIQYMTPKYDEEKEKCEVKVAYRNIFKNSKKVKITPIVTDVNTGEKIEQKSITIDLDKNKI
ncbi:MAG: DUF4179 domain-containing protein [Terrisporobacter sp.]